MNDFGSKEPVDYHPGTHNVVRDLVHPSLYPLIIDAKKVNTQLTNRWGRNYESSRFQWLPSEVDIDGNGRAKFVSSINNLDHTKYPELQGALENVLTALIPGMEKVWQYCLTVQFRQCLLGNEESAYSEPPPVSFSNTRLQVIPKIADYTFAPGASFSGVWHYEGMAHENIVMTGLFYPNSDEALGKKRTNHLNSK